MTARILVAGIGNIFLGDDGFGPAVVRQLTSPTEPSLPAGATAVDYGIRGMHLAYDLLDGYDGLVLVDALPGRGAAGEVCVLEVTAEDLAGGEEGFDAHGMNPVAVLSNLSALGGHLPPTYVVGAAPLDVEEGIGLTEQMTAAVSQAAIAVRALLAERLSGASISHGRTE